ncbi:MAG TPA: glycosyltransferase family 87 protein [Candidatus Binataceae bacterium]
MSALTFYQDSRSSNGILRTAAWILVALYILGFAVSAASRSQSDFVIYRNAGLAALHRTPIYGSHDPSPFQYAPIYAVAFIPLGLLPPRAAQLLWFAASMALALPMMILGASRLLFGRAFKPGWELIVIPLLLSIRFIHPNFDHGQINLLLLAMVVWGLALANEAKPVAAGGLLAASMLAKPFALPVIVYLLARRQIVCVFSTMIFIAALVLLPGMLVGSGYAVHQTGGYLTSLTSRTVQRSRDLKNKYNQSAAALAVRCFAPHGASLASEKVAAASGFGFQCVLTVGVVAWLVFRRRSIAEEDARLSLAALFCIAAAFSPISWIEYYLALEVPYMALAYIAFCGGETKTFRARAATLVLSAALILNFCTRLFESALYYGVAYLGSLMVLAAVIVLTTLEGRQVHT